MRTKAAKRHMIPFPIFLGRNITEGQISRVKPPPEAFTEANYGESGSELLTADVRTNQATTGGMTPETLKAAIDAISLTQARLRESHLKYHLRTAAVLDQNQMQQYAELRGYRKPEHHHHQ